MTTASPVAARWGAAATPHYQATAAAEEAFQSGGNAIDAAIAAAAVLTVVYPNQASIGGDAIAMVGTASGQLQVINGSGRYAANHDHEAFTHEHATMPTVGAKSVTVPGVLKVWEDLTATYGTQGLSPALETAADIAEKGFPIAPGVVRDIEREAKHLRSDPVARQLFFPDDAILASGQTVRFTRLAETLRTLADSGPDEFYGGSIGQHAVNYLRESGSELTVEDFASHRVSHESPAHATFQGDTFFSATGNSQGTYFLQGLRLLEEWSRSHNRVPNPLGDDSEIVAQILRLTANERDTHLGEVSQLSPDELLSDEHIHGLQGLIGSKSLRSPGDSAKPNRRTGDTVAIVTADGDGNVVSLIQSAFHAFGSCVIDPNTGILFHNRGASFTLEPGSASELGASRRPPHTLMPVLVKRGEQFVGVHGTMGGRAQPQIHTHLALQLALGNGAQRSVAAPRWVIGQLEAGPTAAEDKVSLSRESDCNPEIDTAFKSVGFAVSELPSHDDTTGHAQVIRLATDHASFEPAVAVTDPRADGRAVVWHGQVD